MIVTDSREGAGSDLGNPEFSFLNFHFALLAAGSTLGIVDAKPALSTFEYHFLTIFCLLSSIFIPPIVCHVCCFKTDSSG